MALIHNSNHAKQNSFRLLGVKEPRHAKNVLNEKCYLYRSMRQMCEENLGHLRVSILNAEALSRATYRVSPLR